MRIHQVPGDPGRYDKKKRVGRGESSGYGRTSGPVSYTHLRAHETVLDLVCRLLLEKKKQHITTPITTYILLQYPTTP